jgi:hypothetical protein
MTACGKLVTGYNSPDRNDPQAEHWVELRTGYPCSVDLGTAGAHPGPCAAVEQPQTVTARQRWLEADRRRSEDLRSQASGLGETQGRPLTFAENVGADPAITHPAQEVPCPLCEARVVAKDLPDHLRQVHASTAATAIHTAPEPPPVMAVDEWADARPGPTRANRPHDQALPEPNDRPVMHEVLIDLIRSRLAIGIERYGTGLQPMNGRDALRDQVEELIDAAVYTLQIRHEKAEMRLHAEAIYEFFEVVNGGAEWPSEKIPMQMREHIQALVSWFDNTAD